MTNILFRTDLCAPHSPPPLIQPQPPHPPSLLCALVLAAGQICVLLNSTQLYIKLCNQLYNSVLYFDKQEMSVEHTGETQGNTFKFGLGPWKTRHDMIRIRFIPSIRADNTDLQHQPIDVTVHEQTPSNGLDK